MAIKLDLDVTHSVDLAEYQQFVDDAVDVRDLDCLAETTWMLKALANNRTFLAETVNQKVRGFLNGERLPRYTPNSILLASKDEYIIRANIWTPPAAEARRAELEAPLFSYYGYHDHNFHIVTVGYAGSGYETVLYDYDRTHVSGDFGEHVDLTYLERTRLGLGDAMILRGLQDIHAQHPPTELSVSLNLLAAPKEMIKQRQYFFDVENSAIANKVLNLNERFANYLIFARHLADENTTELLVDLARTHPVDGVRLNAVEQLVALKPQEADYFRRVEGTAIKSSAARARSA